MESIANGGRGGLCPACCCTSTAVTMVGFKMSVGTTSILDDATSEIYYAPLVAEESTETVMAGLKEVIEGGKGAFCALSSDRGSHFWLTPKVGGKVDRHRLTQVGRALRQLGVQMTPAYSPQARGRSERNFGTWQGRLPQELRLRQIRTLEAANLFLREHSIAQFNAHFRVQPAQPGSAFMPRANRDLDLIFSLQFERMVNRDNTVSFQNLTLQIEPVRWRGTLAGCNVVVHQLDMSKTLPECPDSGTSDRSVAADVVLDKSQPRKKMKGKRRRRLLRVSVSPEIGARPRPLTPIRKKYVLKH